MKSIKLVLTALLSLPLTLTASEVHYWVVGSFANQSKAELAASNIKSKLGQAPYIAQMQTASGVRYRILLEQGGISRADLAGNNIDTWSLWADVEQVNWVKGPAPIDKQPEPEEAEIEQPSIAMKEPEYQKAEIVAGPKPGESLGEFCRTRAGAKARATYCTEANYRLFNDYQALSPAQQMRYCATKANKFERNLLCRS